MARWILPVALTVFCVTHPAAQGARPVPPDSRLRGPATFKTNECVVTLNLESGSSRPSGETTVLIDDRHRLTLRMLPRISGGPGSITFVPHHFLCDGKSHKVELTWQRGTATYETVFPSSASPFGFRLPALPTLPSK
jgi:hypothetical protein